MFLPPLLRSASICLLASGLLVATGCAGPRMKRLSDTRYDRRDADAKVDVYIGKLDTPHDDVAVIQTEAEAFVDDAVKERQIEDLKARARRLGANAIQEVRILPKSIRGFTVDEAVPFTSFKQGAYEIYFMRATAIYVPETEPRRLADVRPAKGWAVERLTVPPRLETAQALPMPGLAPGVADEPVPAPPAAEAAPPAAEAAPVEESLPTLP